MKKILIVLALVAVGGYGYLHFSGLLDALTPPELPEYEAPESAMWLNQNWSNDARYWYHHTPQGTSTVPVPYEWFIALEQPQLFAFSEIPLFKASNYMAQFGFIPSPAGANYAQAENKEAAGFTESRSGSYTVDYGYDYYLGNPDGLPVGFALTRGQKDPVTGGNLPPQLGFTCAACHTGQFTYQGMNIRIDGGPATINLGTFRKALQVSLAYTKLIPWRFSRFADRVLGENHSDAERQVLKDRFDLLLDRVREVGEVESAAVDKLMAEHGQIAAEGFSRLDALNRIGNQVFFHDLFAARSESFDPAENIALNKVPVNYPHIWSTSWFDWVQYDSSIMRPMVRNAGESLGVAAKFNLVSNDDGRLFDSTVLIKELSQMEDLLAGPDPLENGINRFRGLTAPKWPQNILGKINNVKARKGELLYNKHCKSCHLPPVTSGEFWSEQYWQEINLPGAKGQYLKLEVIPVDEIKTDPGQAEVLATRMVSLPESLEVPEPEVKDGWICGGKAGTKTDKTPFAWALAYVTQKAIDNRYDIRGIPADERERINGNRPNCVRAIEAYKARPLNGIWATAPYLHNGSVLSLHEMLVPAAERAAKFCLGDREFDPVKVGLTGDCGKGLTEVDTTIAGNFNSGHSFEDGDGPGVIGPELSDDQREALVEFLKTL